jgi:DNA-binding XRE family transcriptional regulator
MEYKEYNPKLFKLKRKILNLTCEDIAKICGTTRQTISNIDTGRSKQKSIITFIGYTMDLIAKEQGFEEVFELIEQRSE